MRRLGCLPLAIDQAGAYLHTTRVRLSNYLPLLQPERIRDTLSYRPPAAVWEYSESVFSTWELSFSEIRSSREESAELLSLCSFYSNVDIDPDMLERGWPSLGHEEGKGSRLPVTVCSCRIKSSLTWRPSSGSMRS